MVAGDVRQGQCQVHHNSLIITENKKHNEQHLGGVSIVGSHLLLGKNIVAKLFNSPLARVKQLNQFQPLSRRRIWRLFRASDWDFFSHCTIEIALLMEEAASLPGPGL